MAFRRPLRRARWLTCGIGRPRRRASSRQRVAVAVATAVPPCSPRERMMSYWQSQLSNRLITAPRAELLQAPAWPLLPSSRRAVAAATTTSSSSGAEGREPARQGRRHDVEGDAGRYVGQATCSSDTPGLDPMTNPASTVPPLANFALSRLLKYKIGTRRTALPASWRATRPRAGRSPRTA